MSEKTSMAIYTGHKHLEQVKSVRSINGEVSLNKISPYYSGVDILYGNYNPYIDKVKVGGSEGLQYMP